MVTPEAEGFFSGFKPVLTVEKNVSPGMREAKMQLTMEATNLLGDRERFQPNLLLLFCARLL
jgi:hypothetical protein